MERISRRSVGVLCEVRSLSTFERDLLTFDERKDEDGRPDTDVYPGPECTEMMLP